MEFGRLHNQEILSIAEKKRQSRPNNQNDHLDYRHPTVDKNHH